MIPPPIPGAPAMSIIHTLAMDKLLLGCAPLTRMGRAKPSSLCNHNIVAACSIVRPPAPAFTNFFTDSRVAYQHCHAYLLMAHGLECQARFLAQYLTAWNPNIYPSCFIIEKELPKLLSLLPPKNLPRGC